MALGFLECTGENRASSVLDTVSILTAETKCGVDTKKGLGMHVV